ncbi:MAG: fibronectin type III domain-containing protein [bacterium]
MNRTILIWILIFFAFSCTKEVFEIPEPESHEPGLSPEEFNVEIQKITDNYIIIEWSDAIDPEGEKVKYEISLNDSVIIYDYEFTAYTIENLQPDTEYKIGVIASDINYNRQSTFVNVKTKEQLLRGYFHYDLGFHFDYYFTHAIKTTDAGILIAGRKKDLNGKQFLLKINADFEIQWLKEWEGDYTNHISELIQTQDGGFIIARYKSVEKIDSDGNHIWSYENEIETILTQINAVYETPNGDVVATGTTDLIPEDQENINLKGFIIRLSSNGKHIWHKFYGSTYKNRADQIVAKPNGNIMISGTATNYYEGTDPKNSLWILETDTNGEVVFSSVVGNQFKGDDITKDILLWNNNLLFCGSSYGPMGYAGAYNFIPRFLNMSYSNEIIWDKYQEIEDLGEFPKFDGIIELADDKFSFFANVEKGIYVGTINSGGQLIWELKLLDFPNSLIMKILDNNDIAYLTTSGYLIMVNPNGYED